MTLRSRKKLPTTPLNHTTSSSQRSKNDQGCDRADARRGNVAAWTCRVALPSSLLATLLLFISGVANPVVGQTKRPSWNPHRPAPTEPIADGKFFDTGNAPAIHPARGNEPSLISSVPTPKQPSIPRPRAWRSQQTEFSVPKADLPQAEFPQIPKAQRMKVDQESQSATAQVSRPTVSRRDTRSRASKFFLAARSSSSPQLRTLQLAKSHGASQAPKPTMAAPKTVRVETPMLPRLSEGTAKPLPENSRPSAGLPTSVLVPRRPERLSQRVLKAKQSVLPSNAESHQESRVATDKKFEIVASPSTARNHPTGAIRVAGIGTRLRLFRRAYVTARTATTSACS